MEQPVPNVGQPRYVAPQAAVGTGYPSTSLEPRPVAARPVEAVTFPGKAAMGATSVPVSSPVVYASKVQAAHSSSRVSPRAVFVATGVILLLLLIVVPVWNAVALLKDSNYVFWCGKAVPTWMISLCLTVVGLYAFTVWVFFGNARQTVQSEQTIMMIANIFITMLGLVLMLVSLPLSEQSVQTYNNLMHRCDYSEQTHRMYEYSQVLQNIRSTPACAKEYSVESCVGYEDAHPYTTFLKEMENNLRCSGFCFRPGMVAFAGKLMPSAGAIAINQVSSVSTEVAADALASNTTQQHPASGFSEAVSSMPEAAVGKEAGAARVQRRPVKKHRGHAATPLALLAHNLSVVKTPINLNSAKLGPAFAQPEEPVYPPTLFSDANYQASCDGMAARDMKNFVGDVSYQTFFQGVYLVLIAVATGFLKLIGFCTRKDVDMSYRRQAYT